MKKIVSTVVAVCALMLAGCVNNDPFGTANDPDTITIGSQDYYSNEIIAEIYAQALEKRGHKVKRELRIGQREAYLPENRIRFHRPVPPNTRDRYCNIGKKTPAPGCRKMCTPN